MRSDLELLVDTEARLDRELAIARARAVALEDEARSRIAKADADATAELDGRRARIATETEREAARRVREIEDAAAGEVARFDSIHGERADALARHVVEQLVALVLAEEAP